LDWWLKAVESRPPLGSVCQLLPDETGRQLINAEVVGFRDDVMLLMPYGEMRGIRPGSLIRNTSTPPLFRSATAISVTPSTLSASP
jgi:type III secretion system ATPase, FliI/YscN (EC 3.6.3.15)